MNVNLLYFTLHGTSATEPTAWGAILIEDGEMESFVGVEKTEFTALVDGLQKCLERFPTSLPIVIRSRHRTVNQLGKRWIDTWRKEGWDTEESPELITLLLDTLETRRVEWFQPSYAEALDKSVVEYAIDELEYHQQQSPTLFTHKSVSIEDVNLEPECLSPDDDKPNPSNIDSTQVIPNNLQTSTPEDKIDIPLSDTIEEPIKATIEEHHPIDEAAVVNTPIDIAIPLVCSENDTENLNNERLDQRPIDNAPPISQTLTVQPSIEPEDQIQYPYIDDQGWEQFYTLFDTPENASEQIPPCRILAYVDAQQHVDLASWSFALIDKPSQVALLQSMGLRQITEQQALLQGCITLLRKIRNPNHTIEFRTHRQSMSQLLQMLIADPYAECPTEWEDASALVSQLSFYLEQRQVSVRQISQDKPDFATQIVTHLSRQALNALNTGERVDFTLRKQKFPLERLVD